ncbi:hypothetical protein LWI28_010181 [Acer negundo]|uniref:Uncharacterized protein n=1 Tax=Acer negundo TaxID=4023 RepID=A0AAD5JMR0_ACENE|nr:hypothetical protein LWI28_010181 [Acer negundo]
MVSLAGVAEASLSDGFKRWQSIAMPSNFVSEGSPVNEGEAFRVDGALFKVLSSIATNLGEMREAQVPLQQQSRPSRVYYRSVWQGQFNLIPIFKGVKIPYFRSLAPYGKGMACIRIKHLSQALITQERQALEISQLTIKFAKKSGLLKSASACELGINHGFEKSLRQREAIEDALRKTLAFVETKASDDVDDLGELSLRSSQLEASASSAKLRNAELESKATLAEQEAIKSKYEARTAKKTFAIVQYLMFESQQKSEEAKLHYEKLAEDLRQ